MIMRAILIAIILLVSPAGVSAHTQPVDDEYYDDLIHADLPLWEPSDKVWPQHIADENEIGCINRLKMGDWKEIDSFKEDDRWRRFRNYGVFHCFIMFQQNDERNTLEKAPLEYGFMVEIGNVSAGGKELELWALQMGGRPGSNYILLSRPKGEKGLISAFNVLQRKCPRANVRDAGSLDTLLTRYCAINSKADLIALAKRMANLAPLAKLEWVADIPDE